MMKKRTPSEEQLLEREKDTGKPPVLAEDPRVDLAMKAGLATTLSIIAFFVIRTYSKIDEIDRTMDNYAVRLARIEERMGIHADAVTADDSVQVKIARAGLLDTERLLPPHRHKKDPLK